MAEHQHFHFDVWTVLLSLATCDVDCALSDILVERVPTCILHPIEPSGVWEELLVHYDPWKSAKLDESLTLSLLMKDVEAGHAFVLAGGEEEARRRWGKHVAAGKLGVVHASGKKKPRLFEDGSISGANPSSRIRERVRLPGLHSAMLLLGVWGQAQVGGFFI